MSSRIEILSMLKKELENERSLMRVSAERDLEATHLFVYCSARLQAIIQRIEAMPETEAKNV